MNSPRRYHRASVTVGLKQLQRDVYIESLRTKEPGEPELLEQLRAERPMFRGDCVAGPRPCPWVSCKHHLYLDVTDAGSMLVNFPELEPEQLENSCALDVADRGALQLEQVGEFINVTRERVRQIEAKALRGMSITGFGSID